MKLQRTLETAPAFADFPPDVLEMLGRSMVLRAYPDGEDLVVEGEPARRLLLIVSGEVEVWSRDTSRRRKTLVNLGPGDLFGVIALVDGSTRTATATATGKVEVAELPASAFTMLYESDSPVSVHFQLLIARQLARDARRVNEALRAQSKQA